MELIKPTVSSMIDRGAMDLSHSVYHDHKTFVPSRRKIGARSVRQVMVDLRYTVQWKVWEISLHEGQERILGTDLAESLDRDVIHRKGRLVWGVVETVGQFVNLMTRDSCF